MFGTDSFRTPVPTDRFGAANSFEPKYSPGRYTSLDFMAELLLPEPYQLSAGSTDAKFSAGSQSLRNPSSEYSSPGSFNAARQDVARQVYGSNAGQVRSADDELAHIADATEAAAQLMAAISTTAPARLSDNSPDSNSPGSYAAKAYDAIPTTGELGRSLDTQTSGLWESRHQGTPMRTNVDRLAAGVEHGTHAESLSAPKELRENSEHSRSRTESRRDPSSRAGAQSSRTKSDGSVRTDSEVSKYKNNSGAQDSRVQEFVGQSGTDDSSEARSQVLRNAPNAIDEETTRSSQGSAENIGRNAAPKSTSPSILDRSSLSSEIGLIGSGVRHDQASLLPATAGVPLSGAVEKSSAGVGPMSHLGGARSPLSTLQHGKLVQRVLQSFEQLSAGGGQMRIRLHPPELGTLQLTLRMNEGQIAAQLDVENQSAREALLSNSAHLRDRLGKMGFEVVQFEVNVNSGIATAGENAGNGMSPGGDKQDQSKHTNRLSSNNDLAAQEILEGDESRSRVGWIRNGNNLDLSV